MSTDVQEALRDMILMTEQGRWIRDSTWEMEEGVRKHCALGMMEYTSEGQERGVVGAELGRLLRETIPWEREAVIVETPVHTVVNGGTIRLHLKGRSQGGMIASFNNTVSDVSEIKSWYERALAKASA